MNKFFGFLIFFLVVIALCFKSFNDNSIKNESIAIHEQLSKNSQLPISDKETLELERITKSLQNNQNKVTGEQVSPNISGERFSSDISSENTDKIQFGDEVFEGNRYQNEVEELNHKDSGENLERSVASKFDEDEIISPRNAIPPKEISRSIDQEDEDEDVE